MRIIRTTAGMQHLALRLRREGRRIGFVPTMGCLHAGHLSLVRRAQRLSDVTVVSLFVNPLQFGRGEDYARYPRVPRHDVSLCRDAGVDVLFCPTAAGMYAPEHSILVEETRLSAGLCGAGRPGHFRGVCTVVAKLFNLVQPQVAVFGRKDYQQAAIVRRLARDLAFPVRVVVAPTVREPGGLAMSSRNRRLSPKERATALRLFAALQAARAAFRSGERRGGRLTALVRRRLGSPEGIRPEYVELIDGATLQPAARARRGCVLALAAKVGGTRLIDNVVLTR